MVQGADFLPLPNRLHLLRGGVDLLLLLLASTKTEDEVQRALLLDVVVAEGAAVLELLASEDEPLLVWGDALLVLDLGLHILDRVGLLDLERDCLAGQSLDEYLHGVKIMEIFKRAFGATIKWN